jgi:FixJ family two-component response regulator
MPGLLGTDVLKALRGAGVTVPVILLSGLQIAPTAHEGFFAVLTKPFDLRMLAELVTSAVAQSRPERG